MEQLNLEKFDALSNEELSKIDGGWGWQVDGVYWIEDGEGSCESWVMMSRKRLFGGTEYSNHPDEDTGC